MIKNFISPRCEIISLSPLSLIRKTRSFVFTTMLLALMLGKSASTQDVNFEVSLLETGEFHGNEVTAKSGESWLGLFPTRGGYSLAPTTLEVVAVNDPVEDYPPDRKTGKQVSVVGAEGRVLLLNGATMLRSGAITTVFAGDKNLVNLTTVNLSLDVNGYQLKVVSDDSTPADYLMENSKLLLIAGTNSQILFSMGKHNDAGWQLLWAGDLDGDGKLDLYLQLSDHYNVSNRTLFLSTQAPQGSLVKKIAEFRTVGC